MSRVATLLGIILLIALIPLAEGQGVVPLQIKKLDLTGFKLTFYDDFDSFSWHNGTNNGTWQSYYRWPARTLSGNGELEYYSDSTVGVDPFHLDPNPPGVLEMQANPSANPAATGNLPYTSGMITTFPSFSQTYGYFEIR